MSIDQPITVYPKGKEEQKNGGHTAAEMKKIAEDWEKKNGQAGRIAEKVSLSDYVAGRTKEKIDNS